MSLYNLEYWIHVRCVPGQTLIKTFFLPTAFIQWEYNVQEAIESGDLTKGYWTSDLMLEATHEFMDLFYFLYGGPKLDDNLEIIEGEFVSECYDAKGDKVHHVPIINMDWSSNHAEKTDQY